MTAQDLLALDRPILMILGLSGLASTLPLLAGITRFARNQARLARVTSLAEAGDLAELRLLSKQWGSTFEPICQALDGELPDLPGAFGVELALAACAAAALLILPGAALLARVGLLGVTIDRASAEVLLAGTAIGVPAAIVASWILADLAVRGARALRAATLLALRLGLSSADGKG